MYNDWGIIKNEKKTRCHKKIIISIRHAQERKKTMNEDDKRGCAGDHM